MDDFYAARSRTIPPLPWSNIAPPFSLAAGFEIFIMETDSAFPLFDLEYSPEQISQILSIIGIPELRRDTINVIGRKVSGVVNRHPEAHDLYIASDGDPLRQGMFTSAAKKTRKRKSSSKQAVNQQMDDRPDKL